jgi:uncharacterized sulfatase
MKKLFYLIKDFGNEFTNICIWLLPTSVLIRLFEIIFIIYHDKIDNANILKVSFLGFFYDCIIFLSGLPIFFLLFFIAYLWSKKLALSGLRWIFSFMLFLSISLVMFYVNATFPLGSVFFNYSIREMFEIFATSQTFVWWAYLFLLAIPITYFFISKLKVPYINFLSIVLWISIFTSLFFKNADRNNFKSKSEYYTTINKELYFLKDVFNNIRQNKSILKESISELNTELFQIYFRDLEFVNPEYPFLHKDQTPDRLSSFLELNEESPHIVMVIVEGLGSAFCGSASRYPSPTQFIDSLASTGLYWPNCFSSSPRTVGVLPTILGALPFGAGGFMNYQLSVPNFNSLPLILKDNGYRNAFFYGGWYGFDYMKTFTNLNHFSHYLDENQSYDESLKTKWGLFDHIMFEEAIKTIDFSNKQKRFDLFLTLTTHEPFDDYPNPEKYIKQYRKIMNIETDKEAPPNTHIKFFASYIYADECIRHLINLYSQKEDFDNTIFIITGDHYFDQTAEQMPSTHVPLIIWSPMIKSAHHFKTIASHREITPSIVALLKNNYDIKTPEHVAWLNNGLNTDTVLTSCLFLPQMSCNRGLNYFIINNFFIDNNKQYVFAEKKHLLEIGDESPIDESNEQLANLYRTLDRYVMEKNKLIESKYDNINSNVFFELNKSEIMEIEGTYPLNIVDLNVDFPNLHSVDIYYEFDIKIGSEKDINSVKVVTQIKNNNDENKYYMEKNIFENANEPPEWTHFQFHYTYNNGVFNFKENKKMIVFIYNPENISKILIQNRITKVIINSYK